MLEALERGELDKSLRNRILEAAKKGELEKNQQILEEWFQQTNKYYQTQLVEK